MLRIDRIKRIYRKYYEYVVTKVKLLFEQRIYESDDLKIKYILKKQTGFDSLVVVFSACTRKGLKARYNYVRTLQNIKASRLYILDDFAEDHRGDYYLGSNFEFNEERAVKKLIDLYIKKLQPQKIIFCGSSKGGYSALNFGLMYPNAQIVIGGPQYYLCSYLKSSDNLAAYANILGSSTTQKEEELEFRLREKIKSCKYTDTQHVFIHYSNQEHTYKEHICDLIRDLYEKGFTITEDIASYKEHSDISYYFPDFLKKTIEDIIADHARLE